jgi:bifunctional DNA-binding transcriptional regulator/antitoxin component of YhaV-PrlF toxin-antitoxin module
LEGIEVGDIVEIDRRGRRYHAIVIGPAPDGLSVRPLERVNYYECRAREVIGHWAKRGRPRAAAEPLRPTPYRQLELDTTGR